MRETDLDEFVASGEWVVGWIAEYLRDPERYPVLSRSQPGEIRAQLPTYAPAEPEAMEAILADFEHILMPGMTHWNHPGFMAYFANSSPAPAVLAEAQRAGARTEAEIAAQDLRAAADIERNAE